MKRTSQSYADDLTIQQPAGASDSIKPGVKRSGTPGMRKSELPTREEGDSFSVSLLGVTQTDCPTFRIETLARQIMKVLLKTAVAFVGVVACLLLPANKPRAQEAQPSASFSQSVKLTMIVTDASNHSVVDLRQEEIQLVEEKLPQSISWFAKDTRPVDYALVLDTSGSFKTLLRSVAQTAKILTNSNQPEDETFVESFVNSEHIETTQEFTGDKTKLSAALDSLYVRGGQSAVIDAVYLAVKHTAEYKGGPAERRRAVVVFTDGEDRASFYGSDQLVKLLRENDVQLFIVGITTELDKERGLVRESPRAKAEGLLNRIAEESGGRVFFPRDTKETSEAIEQIAHDLHFQYLIGYQRQGKPEKGFRKIKVKLTTRGREKLTVITRPGYLLNAPGQKIVEKKSS
jgi:Ca-activated chloride channel family protein